MSVTEAVGLALERYQAGQAAHAEQICRQVLAADPSQVDAWHLLGVIVHQQGRKDLALQYLQEAIRLKPGLAQVHCNLGKMLIDCGRHAEALKALERCLQLHADFPDAHFNLGSAYSALGQYSMAVESLQRAVRINPEHIAAQNSLGIALMKLNRHAQAIPVFECVLKLDPQSAIAHSNLSIALRELGRHSEAIAQCERAVALDPRSYDALLNLGSAYMADDRAGDAISVFERALEISPSNPHAHTNLGAALFKLGRLEDAEARCQKALELDPQCCDALNNLSSVLLALQRYDDALAVLDRLLKLEPNRTNAYRERSVALREIGRLEEAIVSCQKAVELDPTRFDSLKSLAVAYLYQGRVQAAVATFDRALAVHPDHADGRTDRAMAYLGAGDFRRGWAEYEWRLKAPSFEPRKFSQPSWDGRPLAGKTILAYAEQGLGDSLQFVRYLSHVRDRGGRVLFECPKSLHRLLQGRCGIEELIAAGSPLPPFDVHAALLSLPHLLNLPEPQASPKPPYLFADPDLISFWKAELRGLKGLKVGINWQGSPIHKSDRFRSIPLQQFLPLAELPGVCLVSLQKGFGREQLHSCSEQAGILDLGSKLDLNAGAFMDTAAVLHCLDLVITSDTALAHLAGALGRPVWLALSAVPDWRWLSQGEKTFWYPSMRLFRQESLGDWGPVFARLATDLPSFVNASTAESPPEMPLVGISPGVLGGTLGR